MNIYSSNTTKHLSLAMIYINLDITIQPYTADFFSSFFFPLLIGQLTMHAADLEPKL